MSTMTITLLFFAFAIVMFVTEKIPLALTSMIVCIGLIITGVLTSSEAFAGFINSNVVLFVAMFVVSGALFETGMANEIGGLVTKFAKTERQCIVLLMILTGTMSGFMSNTGTSAIFIPIILGIAAESGYSRARLLLPMVLASAMGGNLSLVGAPGNLIAQTGIEPLGLRYGFFEYAKVGIPILVVGILYFAFVGYKLLPNTKSESSSNTEKLDFSHIPSWKKKTSLIVLVVAVIAMVFEDVIGIKLHISASIAALFLILTNVITERQAYDSIDLQTIFLFGGTLALANAIEITGAGTALADFVIGLLGKNASPFVLLAAIFLLAVTLTNFMSNTASTALLVPISISIAQGMGADPRAVVMATVIGGSCAYATPIGMPANTMIFSVGGYKFNDYVKAGLPLIVVSSIVSLILLPIFFPFYP